MNNHALIIAVMDIILLTFSQTLGATDAFLVHGPVNVCESSSYHASSKGRKAVPFCIAVATTDDDIMQQDDDSLMELLDEEAIMELLLEAEAEEEGSHDQDDNDDDKEEEQEENGEDEKTLILGFVDMMLQTPVGELSTEEADLMRDIAITAASKSNGVVDEEDVQIARTLLYRQIEEWNEAVPSSNDEATAESLEKEHAFRPKTKDFHTLLSMFERSNNPDKAIHMLSILSDQREIFMKNPDINVDTKPDLGTIKCVLRVLSEAESSSSRGRRDEQQQQQQSPVRGVDRRVLQLFQSLDRDFSLYPDEETYKLVIPIVARSRERGAADRAEKIIREAIQRYPPPSGIDTDLFNIVVTAYAKSRDGSDGAKKAEELIVLMDTTDAEYGNAKTCSPSIRTFTSLIDAYAQQNEWDSVSQADRVLNNLLDQHLDEEGNSDLEPSIATWTIVIAAWGRLAKNNRHGAAERAGRLLKRMEDLYTSGRISCQPDAITYVTCMNAYAFAKGGSGAHDAEQILREMNEVYMDGDDSMKPSLRSIKMIVEAWIKARDLDRAEDLLDDFEEYLVVDLTGDNKERTENDLHYLYRAILFGYALNDNPSRACFYLNLMIDEGMEPDSFCFER